MSKESQRKVYPWWWVLDSTASCHMARDKLAFTEYNLLPEPIEFWTASDYPVEAIAKGTIRVSFSNADWILRKVYHVPELRWNTMSVQVLARIGLFVWFSNVGASVMDEEDSVIVEEASLVKKEGVYVMDMYNSRPIYES